MVIKLYTGGGSGRIALHEASNSLAQWPGGPFCGKGEKFDR
ncbi:MAG: hypothetical protein AABY07_01175 [Nanoarchaeota archaeon]